MVVPGSWALAVPLGALHHNQHTVAPSGTCWLLLQPELGESRVHSRGTAAMPTCSISMGGTVLQKHLLPLLGRQDTNGRKHPVWFSKTVCGCHPGTTWADDTRDFCCEKPKVSVRLILAQGAHEWPNVQCMGVKSPNKWKNWREKINFALGNSNKISARAGQRTCNENLTCKFLAECKSNSSHWYQQWIYISGRSRPQVLKVLNENNTNNINRDI